MTAQLMQRDERPFGITEGGRERGTYLVENARIVHPIAVSWSAIAADVVMSAYGNIYAHYLTCAVWERRKPFRELPYVTSTPKRGGVGIQRIVHFGGQSRNTFC